MLGRGLTKVLALAVVAGMLAGCSLRQMTVNMVGDALAGTGGVYESDNDPELIFDALPFGLKTYESLLAGSPEHPGRPSGEEGRCGAGNVGRWRIGPGERGCDPRRLSPALRPRVPR